MKIIEGSITAPQGFLAQGVNAKIKKNGSKDLGIIYSKTPCSAAGVFTTNRVRAACVDLSRSHLEKGQARAIVVNSGNANACTGERGMADAGYMGQLTAQELGIEAQEVVVASTGVIGVFMPMEKIAAGIKEAAANLDVNGGHNAAQAIMTTDLTNKEIAVEVEIKGYPVRIGAIAKGSGMIHPNMATMLGFITTDANINSDCLHKMLKETTEVSYNMISVDRDTSTNDMVIMLANGMAQNPVIDDINSPEYQVLKQALEFINIFLAKKIARDGEGANHLLEVQVINASDYNCARTIARSVVSSNLTKAAVFGQDPNWGRILAAAGYSGADFNPGCTDVYLGAEKMAENGVGLLFDEEKARQELSQETVQITIDLKSGNDQAVAWGCDLSYDYVRINADYRS